MNAYRWGRNVLAATAAAAILAGGALAQAPAKGAKGEVPAAVVDGTVISMAEVESLLKHDGPKAAQPTEAQKRQMHLQAVGMLIDDVLLQHYLRKHGPNIDPAEINKRLAELTESLKKQGKTLDDFLKETAQTEVTLRGSILTMLQWEAYVREHVTEAQVKQYYDESKDFFDRTVVRASHIVTRVAATAPEAERQAAAEKLRVLRQDILAGKIDFAEAAKKHSQCTSAPNGGDIGYFPRKLAVEEAFGKAAFALRVGEVSDVVQTDYGVHLIKVTDRKVGQPSDYAKIKDEVRELCVEEMRMALLAQERKTAKVEINLP